MKIKAVNIFHAGAEVLRRAGLARGKIRLFGVPQNRRRGMFILMVLLLMGSPAVGCPMCKDSRVENDASAEVSNASVGLNFNNSIYIMLGGFVTMLGLTGGIMYRSIKSPA